jgi:hypothetical protein
MYSSVYDRGNSSSRWTFRAIVKDIFSHRGTSDRSPRAVDHTVHFFPLLGASLTACGMGLSDGISSVWSSPRMPKGPDQRHPKSKHSLRSRKGLFHRSARPNPAPGCDPFVRPERSLQLAEVQPTTHESLSRQDLSDT